MFINFAFPYRSKRAKISFKPINLFITSLKKNEEGGFYFISFRYGTVRYVVLFRFVLFCFVYFFFFCY
jgi:hypothetical protein